MATSRWPVKDDKFNLFAHRSKSKTSVVRAPSKQISDIPRVEWRFECLHTLSISSCNPFQPCQGFSLSPPPFSPIMFGLNKKSICFPFVYFEYTQALLCAYSRVWCTSSSYNAILEGRIHAFFVLLLSHCFAMKTSLARLHQRCSLRLFIPIFLPSYKSTTDRLEVMRNFMMCQKAVIAFRGIQKYTPQPYKN